MKLKMKEPVVAMSIAGLAVGVLANKFGGLDPEFAILLTAAIAGLARRFVIPYLPTELLETFSRLSKDTPLADAVVVDKAEYNRMHIVYRQAMR